MTIAEAQREMRNSYVNGAPGALVSGLLWLTSTILGARGDTRSAVLVLVVGGMFIFPLALLLLTIVGRQPKVSPANPLSALALQVALTIPLALPVVGGAALHNLNWFYPGLAVIVGAHYLPFVTLYGLRRYAVIGAALIAGGVMAGFRMSESFTPAGWFTSTVLLVSFAWLAAAKESARTA